MTYLRSWKFSMIVSLEKNQTPCFSYLRHFLYNTKECQAVLLLECVCPHVVLFCSVALMCKFHSHTYVHGSLSHLCTLSTVTLKWTVHCHTYVDGPLSHLCGRSTVTLMWTVHCHTYVDGPLSHFTKNICLTSVTKSAKIMRLIVSNDKMINGGLDRMWSEAVVT
jgi:hypothetical protein